MIKQHRVLLVVASVTVAALIIGVWPRHRMTRAQEQADPASHLEWHQSTPTSAPPKSKLYRAAVPGGWLVCIERSE